jgi:hypothetical protein
MQAIGDAVSLKCWYCSENSESQLTRLITQSLQSYLEAAQAAVLRERQPEPLPEPKQALDLSAYRHVGHSSGQGVTHEPA